MSAPWSVAQRMPAATSPAVPDGRAAAVAVALVARAPGPRSAWRRGRRRPRRGCCRWWRPRCRPRGCRGRCRPGPTRCSGRASPPVPRQLVWATTLPARSSWPRSMPESMMAIVMPVARGWRPRPAGAPMLLEAPLEALGEDGVVGAGGRLRSAVAPAPATASDRRRRARRGGGRGRHPSPCPGHGGVTAVKSARATEAQRRRRTVTTRPNTATSSAGNSMGERRSFGGQQGDGAALALVGLHGGLVAGDPGDDDVAVVGGGLGPADDVVAVDDGRLDHRVAPDPQHEQVALAREVGREGERLLDVLLGQHVGAGGDVAHQGHVAHGAPLDRGARRWRRTGPRWPGAWWGPGAGSPAAGAWPGGRGRWTGT